MKINFMLLAATIILPCIVQAAQWHVDQSAAAGGDGTAGAPFQTINAVRSVLRTGDTVHIYDGVYRESVDFWRVKAGTGGQTIIRAAEGHSPIIESDGRRDFVFQAGETHGMKFQGLVARNARGSGFHFYYADDGQVLDCRTENVGRAVSFYYSSRGYVYQSDMEGGISGKESDGTVIEACRVHHSNAEGITLHADSKNLKYLNNIVYDNHSVNIYIDSAYNVVVDGNLIFMSDTPEPELAGIQMADESYRNVTAPLLKNIVITNNIIVNTRYGIVFWDGHFPGQSGMRNVLIANNTVINSHSVGIVWEPGPHSDAVVRNNIFASDGVGVLLLNAKSVDGVTLDHNLWYMPGKDRPFNWGGGTVYTHADWVSLTGHGEGDVLAGPLFEGTWGDLGANTYRLTKDSPAIDSGQVIDVLTKDFDRVLRPNGKGHDLGACEFDHALAQP